MIELPFVFLSGLLGSGHCLGMCGPFALAIGAAGRGWRQNFARQLGYTAGRVFTYSFLGMAAALGSASLGQRAADWVRLPAVLAIAAGLFLVYQGLVTAGVIRGWTRPQAGNGPCLAAGFFRSFLNSPQASQVFVAGLLTGFLPCGLVYALLALAASTGSVWQGAGTMALFGLGTAPMMVLFGCGSSLLSWNWRTRVLRMAAWCIVIAGVISIARGVGGLQAVPACPFCEVHP